MLVSVIIPYNEDRGYLHDAIESAENQDGFTLGVDYEIVLQKGDCYVAKNVNDAVARSQGKYIKKLDEDDLLLPNCLIDLYTFAEAGQYDFVCADAINFDEDGNTLVMESRIPETIAQYAFDKGIHISSGLYLKSAMLPVNEKLWTAEDFDLLLRMMDAGRKIGYLHEVVYKSRIWDLGKSTNYLLHTDRETGDVRFRYEYVEEIMYQYEFNNKQINR